MKSLMLFCVTIFAFTAGIGQQSKIDSLLSESSSTLSQKDRMEIFSQILQASWGVNDTIFKTYLDSLGIESRLSKQPKYKAHYYRFKSTLQITESEFEQAKKNLEESKELYTSINDTSGLISIYTNLATLSKRIGKKDSAAFYYLKSIKWSRNSQAKPFILKNHIAHYNLALLLHVQGENDLALKHLDTAIIKAKEADKRNYGASSLYLLGTIQGSMGNEEGAIESLREAIPIFEEYGEFRFQLAAINNLSKYVDDEEAIGNFTSIINALNARGINDFHLSSNAYTNLSYRLIENNELELASKYLDTAFNLSTQAKNKDQLARVDKTRGDLEIKRKNIVLAIALYERALKQFNVSGDIIEKKATLRNLSEAYVQNNDFKNAYLVSRAFYVVKDSIYNIENSTKINELKEQYESEKKNNTILTQSIEIEKRRKTQNRAYFFLAIVIIIALCLAYFLYKWRKNLKSERYKFSQEVFRREQLEKIIKQLHNDKQTIDGTTDLEFLKFVKDKVDINQDILDVYVELVKGKTYKEIANTFYLSIDGAKTRVKKLYDALKIYAKSDYDSSMTKSESARIFNDLRLAFVLNN